MQSQKISTLIVGATGQLGSLITKHALLQKNLQVNILVRNPDKNKDLVESVTKAGGQVIKGDVSVPESLKGATKGIHTVVSALIGDDATVLDGQRALLADAVENQVKRFVPSDFSADYTKIGKDEHPLLRQRIIFREELAKSEVKGLHVFQGVFMETFFWMNSKGFGYWGTPDQLMDITSYEDSAKFLVAALANPDRVGDLKVSSNKLTMKQVVEIYNKVTGQQAELIKLGSLEDLQKQIDEAKKNHDFMKSIMLGYAKIMSNGSGYLEKVDNDEFPDVKTTSLEDFLKSRK